jgi:pimeloyl-ACP methyl ester carboxylesterase
MAVWNVYRARRAEGSIRPRGRSYLRAIFGYVLVKGQGRPVVLLHGNGATADDFQLSGLLDLVAARQYRALTFDRPGFG